MTAPIMELNDVSITYRGEGSGVPAVRNVSLSLAKGEVLGIVGESGSGKSSLVAAMLALLPKSSRLAGSVRIDGRDLYALNERAQRDLRGAVVATVSQDPFTALNPVVPIGRQLVEFQHRRRDIGRTEKYRRATDMLARVGLSDPELRMKQFPHQLSGGIRQRVAIAAALLVNPRLLIADEPTTALDATTEQQILALINELRGLVDGSIVLVTHDMGVVAHVCDRVAVMYAGELVETGTIAEVFEAPRHPYTAALLECDPARIDTPTRHLPTIGGTVPSPQALPAGCIFAERCPRAEDRCRLAKPVTTAIAPGRRVACHLVAA
jgi:peptide/nickel transport system ATP-binding protein